MQEKGLYRGKADNKMSLPVCSRSKDIIEPLLKPQWWVDCSKMAADAGAAAKDGRLQILPQVRCIVEISSKCSRPLFPVTITNSELRHAGTTGVRAAAGVRGGVAPVCLLYTSPSPRD